MDHGWDGWRAGLGGIVLSTLNKCEREAGGVTSTQRPSGWATRLPPELPLPA